MVKVKVCSNVGQSSRSRSRVQKLLYGVKGLVTKNTRAILSPILVLRKLLLRFKFFKSRSNFSSRSQGKKLRYNVKGRVTSDTHVQYESPITSGLKFMAKVKVFVKQVKVQGQGYKVKNYSAK